MTLLNRIPGQAVPKKILLNSYNRSRIASTYLFYGKDGIGKWPVAIWLAALLNCENIIRDENGAARDACGGCRNCRQILNNSFPELHYALPLPPHKNESEFVDLTLEFLQTKQEEPFALIQSSRQLSIPIKTAREIKRKTSIRPEKGLTRVVIFYGMERMLPASADSLLKLIEEPPPETVIILTARDPESLLPTIQSRAQKIFFKRLSVEGIAGYLESKYDIDSRRAQLLAQLSDGSIGQAISMLNEEEENSARQVSFLMFKSLFHRDADSGISAINELIQPRNRGATELTLAHWQSFISDIILIKYVGETADLVNIDLKKELEGLAGRIGRTDSFSQLTSLIGDLLSGLRRNVHIRPAIIDLSFRMRRLLHQSA